MVSPKICFVTSLFANNFRVADRPAPFKRFGGHDFVLFTNLPARHFNTGWTIRTISEPIQISVKSLVRVKQSRYPKFLGWKLLELYYPHRRYDAVFYCDAAFVPQAAAPWKRFVRQIKSSECGMLTRSHPLGRTPFTECQGIEDSRKDCKENMDEMRQFLVLRNCSESYRISQNTTFGYDPQNARFREATEEFWAAYSTLLRTHRDQPLWGYICFKHQLEAATFDAVPRETCFKKLGRRGFNNHKYRAEAAALYR